MTDPRPEVVERIIQAITRMDPSALDGLTNITPAEREAANNLVLQQGLAESEHHDRQLEVWDILLRRGPYDSSPSWEQLFDGLDDRSVEELRRLYWDMPDGARAEFDRRHGAPGWDE